MHQCLDPALGVGYKPVTVSLTTGQGAPAMKRIILLITSTVCLAILVTLFMAPSSAEGKNNKHPKPGPSPTAYNPYPPGILPPDLD
jgi:hypothetical protein